FQLPRWKLTTCCGDTCGHGADAPHAAHANHPHGPSETGEGKGPRANPREFLGLVGGAAAGAMGLAMLSAGGRQAQAQGTNMPAAVSNVSPIDGLFDFHVHTSP